MKKKGSSASVQRPSLRGQLVHLLTQDDQWNFDSMEAGVPLQNLSQCLQILHEWDSDRRDRVSDILDDEETSGRLKRLEEWLDTNQLAVSERYRENLSKYLESTMGKVTTFAANIEGKGSGGGDLKGSGVVAISSIANGAVSMVVPRGLMMSCEVLYMSQLQLFLGVCPALSLSLQSPLISLFF